MTRPARFPQTWSQGSHWKSKTQKNIEPIKNIVISTPEPVINDVENMQISNDVNPPKIAAQDNEKIKKKAHVKRTKKKYG